MLNGTEIQIQRESLRANSLVINLAFSIVCLLFEERV